MNSLNHDKILEILDKYFYNNSIEIKEEYMYSQEDIKNAENVFKVEANKDCPVCKNSENVIKYGKSKKGIQRYRCKKCCKNFSDITGSPLSYSKKPIDMWIKYMFCIKEKLTLRKIAEILNIDLKTSFHWRHKILSVIGTKIMNKKLFNIEVDEIRLKESFKGNHSINKNFSISRLDKESYMLNGQILKRKNIIILNCKDIEDNKFIKPSSKSFINGEILHTILKPIIDEKSRYIATPRNWTYFYFAKDNKMKVIIDGSMGFNTKYFEKLVILNTCGMHNKEIIKRGREFKKFLKSFHNVASKYLSFYINWFVITLEETNMSLGLLKKFITGKKQLRAEDFKIVNYKGEIFRDTNFCDKTVCEF